MKVVIAGEVPFVGEVGELSFAAGHDTILFLVEDFISAIQSGYMMDDLADVDVVIELHNESAAAKNELLMQLSNAIPPQALLLTSALAASTTLAASWVPNPARVVGFGVLPPLAKTGAVELAAGLLTAPASLEMATAFWEGLGYTPFHVADGPGLIRARVVCCLINEAIGALMEGIATADDIDNAMKLGTNYPLGPLEWADYLGLDTVLGVMRGLFEEWGDDRYRPSPLLKRMVLAGRLGKKSQRGFYHYAKDGARLPSGGT